MIESNVAVAKEYGTPVAFLAYLWYNFCFYESTRTEKEPVCGNGRGGLGILERAQVF